MSIVEIFDVEHGACSLLTADNGARIMIDCGHNGSTNWRPGWELAQRGVRDLEMLVVTNYDEDHVSGLGNLLQYVSVKSLLRNQSVDVSSLGRIKSEHGAGPGINALAGMMRTYTVPGLESSAFRGIEWNVFWNRLGQFDDENNLSLVMWVSINGLRFLFPGDLESAGWRSLLSSDAGFRDAVSGVDVLVAAHHGRRSGYCEELFTHYSCRPQCVVISDEGIQYETQMMTSAYGSAASGVIFRGEARRVLSTRRDGKVTFACVDGRWAAN